jgi:hypothetical protein
LGLYDPHVIPRGLVEMTSKWNVNSDYSVEIWFLIEKDLDGYPKSKNWEQLLAHPLREREDCFQLASIPFFLKTVSFGDIVRAKTVVNHEIQESEIFEFEAVLDRSGHNTYRLLLRRHHANDPEFTETELIQKGLAIEVEGDNFFAVDVPPSVDQNSIDSFLVAESSQGDGNSRTDSCAR